MKSNTLPLIKFMLIAASNPSILSLHRAITPRLVFSCTTNIRQPLTLQTQRLFLYQGQSVKFISTNASNNSNKMSVQSKNNVPYSHLAKVFALCATLASIYNLTDRDSLSPTPYKEFVCDHEFLRKAGFRQGLPYWYLNRFATKFKSIPLKNDLNIKINLSSYPKTISQPNYLLPHEIIPMWTGSNWHYSNTSCPHLGGIKIIIEESSTKNKLASCHLSPTGKISSVHVNTHSRGKGYGTLLLSIVKQIALEAGIPILYLHVDPYDLPNGSSWEDAFDKTILFYKKNGFIGDRAFCPDCVKSGNHTVNRMIYKII